MSPRSSRRLLCSTPIAPPASCQQRGTGPSKAHDRQQAGPSTQQPAHDTAPPARKVANGPTEALQRSPNGAALVTRSSRSVDLVDKLERPRSPVTVEDGQPVERNSIINHPAIASHSDGPSPPTPPKDGYVSHVSTEGHEMNPPLPSANGTQNEDPASLLHFPGTGSQPWKVHYRMDSVLDRDPTCKEENTPQHLLDQVLLPSMVSRSASRTPLAHASPRTRKMSVQSSASSAVEDSVDSCSNHGALLRSLAPAPRRRRRPGSSPTTTLECEHRPRTSERVGTTARSLKPSLQALSRQDDSMYRSASSVGTTSASSHNGWDQSSERRTSCSTSSCPGGGEDVAKFREMRRSGCLHSLTNKDWHHMDNTGSVEPVTADRDRGSLQLARKENGGLPHRPLDQSSIPRSQSQGLPSSAAGETFGRLSTGQSSNVSSVPDIALLTTSNDYALRRSDLEDADAIDLWTPTSDAIQASDGERVEEMLTTPPSARETTEHPRNISGSFVRTLELAREAGGKLLNSRMWQRRSNSLNTSVSQPSLVLPPTSSEYDEEAGGVLQRPAPPAAARGRGFSGYKDSLYGAIPRRSSSRASQTRTTGAMDATPPMSDTFTVDPPSTSYTRSRCVSDALATHTRPLRVLGDRSNSPTPSPPSIPSPSPFFQPLSLVRTRSRNASEGQATGLAGKYRLPALRPTRHPFSSPPPAWRPYQDLQF